ncbi:MAG: iron-containing alcohol dehydrogenase [Clostridiales bacterium]|nr:iron-containing alcohol dehydrogenase [Clostridiales bacterium]
MKKAVYLLNLLLLGALVAFDVMLILSPALWLKSASSACFAAVGIVNIIYALKQGAKKAFPALMLVGLIFAMAGDIINYNPGDLFFIVGTALFALAHVFYIAAYYTVYKFHLLDLIISAVIFVPSVLFITLSPMFDFGGTLMKIVCVAYALILSVMVGKALSDTRKGTALSVLIAVGSVLFFVSDLSLLINMFSAIHAIPRILCLATYYPAQFMLAFSLILYGEKGVNFFKALYCRVFQLVLKIALPLLPYRDPKVIEKITEVPAVLKDNGKTHALIVTDKNIRALGLTESLEKALSAANIKCTVFDGAVPNPTTDDVNEALNLYKSEGCDCLIGFGGGSPMDCAKCVGALIARPKKTLGKMSGILKVGKKTPLLLAVPTTAGTGSETTLAAVVVDSATRHKYAINDFPLIPSYAVLDEDLLSSLPKHIISTTGLDALTHAIEAYIGKGGNASTRRDALDAVKLVFENLESFYGGDKAAAKNMLLASHKAGRAFSKAYVGYVHALAHPLGGKYNIAHGLANAVILPVVLREYGNAVQKKLWKIARFCGLVDGGTAYGDGAEAVISKIEAMNAAFGIGKTFPEIRRGDLEELSSCAEKEANPLYPVPVLWDKEKLKDMYIKLRGENTDETDIAAIVQKQRKYFESGATLSVKQRLARLKALHAAINANLPALHEGLKADLGKSAIESYMCETGLALSELSYMIKHLKRFAKPKTVTTPIAQAISKSYRLPSPYGTVLIMNPWNYPFLLSIDPLIDAVAAGNTVVLKLSAYSPNVNKAIKEVIDSVFPPEYVTVLFGGAKINQELMETEFDYIFFTGSKRVGQLVYENAAKRLTPVTLELGGKSPCIVDETADIPLAAKRIVWGKYLNLGQTCVAPDYIYCAESIHDRLIEEIKKQIVKQFGTNPLENPTYGKIINEKHFNRVGALIDKQKVVHGGKTDAETLKIEPTVMDNVCHADAVMQEEIFGPVLPVLTYKEESEVVRYVKENDAPLALYLFSSDKARIKRLTNEIGFGGGCVNDVVIHLATPYMPFGGFGKSGLGSYHGKVGFETFSHYKSIVDKSTLIDLPMRYQPYTKVNEKLIKFFLK